MFKNHLSKEGLFPPLWFYISFETGESQSKMDVIEFEGGHHQVIYRVHGEHCFKVGVDGVVSITETSIALPRAPNAPSITNICGSFKCAFEKQGREGILFKNQSFGGHHVMHHLDGLLQVFK